MWDIDSESIFEDGTNSNCISSSSLVMSCTWRLDIMAKKKNHNKNYGKREIAIYFIKINKTMANNINFNYVCLHFIFFFL